MARAEQTEVDGPAPSDGSAKLTAAERLDSIKLILGVIAGVGGVVALAVAYRKQRFGEDESERERTGAFTERLVKAAEQMGKEQAQVRVAGVYALANLADDWVDGRQMCVDVLCAYVRMPHETADPAVASGEREVRRTLFRVIRNHLRPSTEWSAEKWSRCRFSFEGAVLEVGDLSGAVLEGPGHMTFHNARFTGWFSFDGVRLKDGANMWFTRTTFAGTRTRFDDADFTEGHVDFRGAQLLSGVSFTNLKGSVAFDKETRYVKGAVQWGPVAKEPARSLPKTGPLRRALDRLRS